MNYRTAHDTGAIEFDSSIPQVGTRENPMTISHAYYLELQEPEFITQTPVNSLGEYTMIFKCKGYYYKTKHEL